MLGAEGRLLDRQGRIHKRGPRLLRSALVEAAWLLLRYNPWARALYERLCGGEPEEERGPWSKR